MTNVNSPLLFVVAVPFPVKVNESAAEAEELNNENMSSTMAALYILINYSALSDCKEILISIHNIIWLATLN